jgi:hypothetical protein
MAQGGHNDKAGESARIRKLDVQNAKMVRISFAFCKFRRMGTAINHRSDSHQPDQ